MLDSHPITARATFEPAEPPSPVEGPRTIWVRAVSSLQCKATVLFGVLILAVTGGVSGYLLRHSARLVRSEQEAHLVQVASLLADSIAPALRRGDEELLRASASRLVDNASHLSVLFADVSGRVIATEHRMPDRLPPPITDVALPPDEPPGVRLIPDAGNQSAMLQVTYPVRNRKAGGIGFADHETGLLGYVRLMMPADQWERSMANRLDLLVGVGMIVLLAFVPLGFVLVRRIVAPVESLADSMSRFAAGDMTVRSAIDRRDEIGRLARAFNEMAERHLKTHQGMVRLNVELEERVASRTRQLREIASREPLTGLFNRRHFNEVLQRRFAEAIRYDSELSCIMIDLDGFKDVNDAFGHQIGDEILVLAGSTVLGQLRTADVAARYGGDEFIILLPQTDAKRAEVLADRIMQKFNREIERRYPDATVGMSIGVGSLKALRLVETEELVRSADNAMYRAKAQGKNRIVGCTPQFPVEAPWRSP